MLLSQYTIFPKPIILFCAIHITGNRISNKKQEAPPILKYGPPVHFIIHFPAKSLCPADFFAVNLILTLGIFLKRGADCKLLPIKQCYHPDAELCHIPQVHSIGFMQADEPSLLHVNF